MNNNNGDLENGAASTELAWLRVPQATRLGCGGFLYGAVTAVAAIDLASSVSYGWLSALYSLGAIVLVPLLSLTWLIKDRILGLLVLSVIVVLTICSDVLIVYSGIHEGIYQFRRALGHSPGSFLCWMVLWGAWNVFSVIVLAKSIVSRLR